MGKYDELIKRLRDAAKMSEALAVLLPHSEGGATAKLYIEAADAIEKLSKALDAVNDAHNEGYDVGYWAGRRDYEPKWISVTERLPEKTNHYLVRIKCGCDGKLVSAWEQVAWFCEKFYWEHMYSGEVFEETITHWMPLPEPPKEEI